MAKKYLLETPHFYKKSAHQILEKLLSENLITND